MRMRRRKKSGDDADVMMSPLIDCVFLLLIFFLVTSVLKRWERQIPVTLADPTASIAAEIRSDAYLLGLSIDGQVYQENGRNNIGIVQFAPVSNLEAVLTSLIAERGPNLPIELVVEQDTPFQTVIDMLDRLQDLGLTQVRSRIRDGQL